MLSATSWSYRKTLALAPLMSSGVLLSVLAVLYSQTSTTALWLAIFIDSLGIVLLVLSIVDIHRLFNALKQGQEQRMAVQEAERRRLAQDLHDDALQYLIDLKRGFTPEKVDHVIAAIRRACQHLKPLMLEELGLAYSLRFLADEFISQMPHCALSITLDDAALETLPEGHQLVVFRVVQESLVNCRRHAQASTVQVILSYDPAESRQLRLTILDNGVGLPGHVISPSSSKKESSALSLEGHLGVMGIRDRVTDLGGTVTWHSRHTKSAFQGTKLVVVLPT